MIYKTNQDKLGATTKYKSNITDLISILSHNFKHPTVNRSYFENCKCNEFTDR